METRFIFQISTVLLDFLCDKKEIKEVASSRNSLVAFSQGYNMLSLSYVRKVRKCIGYSGRCLEMTWVAIQTHKYSLDIGLLQRKTE